MKKILLTVLVVFLALVAGVVGFAYSGIADVAATSPHSTVVEWFLAQTRERAIERRVADVEVPDLSSEALFETGLAHYHEMCVTCHGAPGVERSEIGRGLNPPPPDLATATLTDEEAAESFWIIRHGLRMTGMPAFGPTHSDEEIWGLVAVQKRLADLTPEQYARRVEQLEPHDHGDPAHGAAENSAQGGAGEETPGHAHEDGHEHDH